MKHTVFIQEGNIYPGSHWFQKGHLSAKVPWCTVNWMPGMWKVKMWLAANTQKALGILVPPFSELVRLKAPKVAI